jgi:hypothetical protein
LTGIYLIYTTFLSSKMGLAEEVKGTYLGPPEGANPVIENKGEGTPRKLATAISEKCRRFQAGNWFPD